MSNFAPLGLGRRQVRAVVAGLAFSAAGGLGLVALASPHAADAPPGPPHGMSMRDGPMGMGLGMPFAGPMSGRLLQQIDATPEQREQLRIIAEAARNDLKSGFEAGKADRERMMSLFTQPVVDAGAAEALRKQMQARQDIASKRMTQAMVESAKVLTVEQRQKMAELMKQHAEHLPPHAARAGQAAAARGPAPQ